MLHTALTIAGSDSSGGAGIQADLKTFAACGVFGMSAITAITAQNTCGVTSIRELDQAIIRDQIAAVYTDIPVDAVKIGMLSSAAIINTVADALLQYRAKNVVLDTVMIAKSGSYLLQPNAVAALIERLVPLALIVTPNLYEASEIAGFSVEDRTGMEKAAIAIKNMGSTYVLIKGGHLPGDACDLLYDGRIFTVFSNERIDNAHTHGTGCTFSSAIAAGLAKGLSVETAIREAKRYVTIAIQHGFQLGGGVGPTHHFYELYRKSGLIE
ncbi:MAG: bifunctional hydroxymethylpyrimidine kinase/phosphomethylpyrimidine kinase [Veillonellales bacterium]